MQAKIVKFFLKCKYELVLFLMLLVQACFNLDFVNGMDRNFLLYYLVDFSMGKTSRLLIGSLVNLLTDNPTKVWINCFAGVVLLLTFIFTSVILGRIIRNSDESMKPCVFALSLFFVSGAFTFYGFSKFFGMLDIYMYLFTVFSLMAVRSKLFKWLIPIFCACGILVNYTFAISFFPAIALALLYLIATEKNKAGNSVLLAITVAVSLALTVYCIFIGEHFTTVTLEEMWNTVEQKSGMKFDYSQMKYYDYYLLGEEKVAKELGISLDKSSLLSFVKMYYDYMTSYGYDIGGIISVAAGVLPILAVFILIWVKCIKLSEAKSRKFVYLCFILSMLFIVICCLTSTDVTRWAGAGVIVQFMLAYFMLLCRDEAFETVMLQIKDFMKNKTVIFIFLFLIYAFGFNLSLTG